MIANLVVSTLYFLNRRNHKFPSLPIVALTSILLNSIRPFVPQLNYYGFIDSMTVNCRIFISVLIIIIIIIRNYRVDLCYSLYILFE